jgi:hypothetical protein
MQLRPGCALSTFVLVITSVYISMCSLYSPYIVATVLALDNVGIEARIFFDFGAHGDLCLHASKKTKKLMRTTVTFCGTHFS